MDRQCWSRGTSVCQVVGSCILDKVKGHLPGERVLLLLRLEMSSRPHSGFAPCGGLEGVEVRSNSIRSCFDRLSTNGFYGLSKHPLRVRR